MSCTIQLIRILRLKLRNKRDYGRTLILEVTPHDSTDRTETRKSLPFSKRISKGIHGRIQEKPTYRNSLGLPRPFRICDEEAQRVRILTSCDISPSTC
ncbi:hypothetical protein N7490_011785 [Penicillium lividum]|nr:hypothetical protein N7490_011785 [Penicillium lividum]